MMAMKFIGLDARRARGAASRRTLLTVLSVAIAVFLFAVAARRARRLQRRRRRQLVDAHRDACVRRRSCSRCRPATPERIQSTPGVQDVTWANWFGGIYKRSRELLRAVRDRARELPAHVSRRFMLTPEERKAFLDDRTGCIIGDGLAKRFGFKVGDKITLQVGIPIYGTQDFRLHRPRHLLRRRRGGRQPVDVLPLEATPTSDRSSTGRSAGIVAQIAEP